MEGLYTNKIPIDKDSVAMGDTAIIEIIEQPNSARKYGNIFIPGKSSENTALILGMVKSVGHISAKEGMEVGDLVFYDKGSAYGHPPETVGTFIITHMENIIAKVFLTPEYGIGDAIPYGDRIMVEEFKAVAEMVGDIHIAESAQERSNKNKCLRLGVGAVDKEGNHTEFPFAEGDQLVLDYDKCDEITVNLKKRYIIKLENVIGLVVEDKPKAKKKIKKASKKK